MSRQTTDRVAGEFGARHHPPHGVNQHVAGIRQLPVLRRHARVRLVEPYGERHRTGHVLRAGAQPALLTAAGKHRLDRGSTADQQRPQSLGRTKLVSGHAQRVHIPIAHADGNLPGRLHGVHMNGNPVRVGDADQFLHGFHGADLVVGQHGGDHRGTFTGLAVELAFKCVEIEMCLRIHGNAHDFETEPFVQPCRRLGHGRVLDSGNDNARATVCACAPWRCL